MSDYNTIGIYFSLKTFCFRSNFGFLYFLTHYLLGNFLHLSCSYVDTTSVLQILEKETNEDQGKPFPIKHLRCQFFHYFSFIPLVRTYSFDHIELQKSFFIVRITGWAYAPLNFITVVEGANVFGVTTCSLPLKG